MSALGQYLAGKGYVVDDNPVYGRDATWRGVSFVMVHHYVGSEDPAKAASEAQYAKTGTSYPPICQIYLDVTGKVWMISKERSGQSNPGRATHAGEGGPFMGVPKGRMNEYALGIECQNDGSHPIADNATQYQALIRLCADLCRRYGLDASKVIGHKEWAPGRKVDPRDDMNKIRADVAANLGGTPPPPTNPPPPQPTKVTYRQGKKVYESKMRKGQTESDSVWNLTGGLKEKGYWTAGQTDDYTQAVVDAVARYQRAQGWSGSDADGIAGPTTVGRLGLVWVDETPAKPAANSYKYRQGKKVYESKMRFGQKNSDSVWNLDLGLINAGYGKPIMDAGGPTDDYGNSTKQAVMNFQKAQGWTGSDADGIAGKTTVGRLGLVWVDD